MTRSRPHAWALATRLVAGAALCGACAADATSKPAQAPAPNAEFDHTASCVAAMKSKAGTLGERYRAGDEAVRPELLSLTEAGFAFIGAAYEAGLRKDDADRRLADAEEQQKALPAAELARLIDACHAEGRTLLDKSNAFERALVRNAARMRVKRMRDK